MTGLVVSHEGRALKLLPKPLLGESLTIYMVESCLFENGTGPESLLAERLRQSGRDNSVSSPGIEPSILLFDMSNQVRFFILVTSGGIFPESLLRGKIKMKNFN